jgi:hypothetical protein
VLQLTQAVPASIAESAESVQAAYRDYQELSLGRERPEADLHPDADLACCWRCSPPSRWPSCSPSAWPRRCHPRRRHPGGGGRRLSPRARLIRPRRARRADPVLQPDDAPARRGPRVQAETPAAPSWKPPRPTWKACWPTCRPACWPSTADGRLRAANRRRPCHPRDDLAGFEHTAAAAGLAAPRRSCATPSPPACGEASGRMAARDRDAERRRRAAGAAGARLAPAGGTGGGCVVVFDDITQLIAAQRSAAWGEVARRLAHEIKNPLTPIQLSAERLQFKLADKLTGAEREMLERGDADHREPGRGDEAHGERLPRLRPPAAAAARPARPQRPRRARCSASTRPRAPASRWSWPTTCRAVPATPTQLRQVIHNLVANAEDALAETSPSRIASSTARAGGRGAVLR